MIVKMKSIVVLGLEAHADSMVHKLQELGVLHVRHVNPPAGYAVERLSGDMDKATQALAMLPAAPEIEPRGGGWSVVQLAYEVGERLRALKEEVRELEQEAARVAYLGDFDPESIHQLRGKGVDVQLFELDNKDQGKLPEHVVWEAVGRRGKKTIIAVFWHRVRQKLPFEELPIPRRSVVELRTQIDKHRDTIARLAKELERLAPHRCEIERKLAELAREKECEEVAAGKGEQDGVVFLRGYCPVPEVKNLQDTARRNGWGVAVEDPTEDEEPPTLLRNPKWVRLIRPVFSLIQTVPGYRELDVSMWFLLFFSIFFALLIGDAGYGLIFLGVTALVHAKLHGRVQVREPFFLMYVLSVCTIVWGAATGNWLGIEALSTMTPFEQMIVPPLYAFDTASQDTVIDLCLLIGAVQLSIGHGVVALRQIDSLKALAQVGWIAILWAIFFLARHLVLGHPLPDFFRYAILGGVGLVVLFTAPQRNVLKGLLVGLGGLPMATINAFADTMSYIRLFAVGMATLAVAQSFNEIGMQVGYGHIFRGIGASLILVLGHALNIVLALMAVIVHGVRLNMLEFSSHVGNTWSGYPYRPFGGMRSNKGRQR